MPQLNERGASSLLALAAFVLSIGLAIALVFPWVALTTARHDLEAERRARCSAEVQLFRLRYPDLAMVAAPAAGGPDGDCAIVAQLRSLGAR